MLWKKKTNFKSTIKQKEILQEYLDIAKLVKKDKKVKPYNFSYFVKNKQKNKCSLSTFRNIAFSSNLSKSMINNPIIKNAVETKIRQIIDPSNASGDPNHPSLRGTTITLVKVLAKKDLITIFTKIVVIEISKIDGTSLEFSAISVRKFQNLKKI